MKFIRVLSFSALAAGLVLAPLSSANAAQNQSASSGRVSAFESASTSSTQATKAVKTPAPQSSGGRLADLSEAPYIAQVNRDGVAQCAGELIASKWVLTTSMCANAVDPVSVNLGSTVNGEGKRVTVKRVVRWYAGDLALLELNQAQPGPYASLSKSPVPTYAEGRIFGFTPVPSEQKVQFLRTVGVSNMGSIENWWGVHVYNLRGECESSWTGTFGGPFVVNGKVVAISSSIYATGSRAEGQYLSLADAALWIKTTSGVTLN